MGKNSGEERPLISVIVPVYNAFELLPRCVESIQAQTYDNLEIILIDDGSNDGSSELCDSYASKDTRIHAVHQSNTGVSAARNKGLDMAQGEWIGFVDADDWIEPEMFERLLGAALESGKQISVCGRIMHYPGGWSKTRVNPRNSGVLSKEESLEYAFSVIDFSGSLCNKLFNRAIIYNSALKMGESIHYCEDLLFCVQCFIQTDGVYFLTDAFYHYCLQENGAVMSFGLRRLTELIARREVFSLIESCAVSIISSAKLYFTDSAINMIYLAARCGDTTHIHEMRKIAMQYFGNYLISPKKELRMKFRGIAIILFPKLTNRIWQPLKKKLGVSWYKEVVSIN